MIVFLILLLSVLAVSTASVENPNSSIGFPQDENLQTCSPKLSNLVLSFEEKHTRLYLLVYLDKTSSTFKLLCFTNAATLQIRKEVEVKNLVYKHSGNADFPDPLEVYQLKPEKYLGEYWCRALLANSTILESNRILAYQRKKGNEFALRLVATHICTDLEDFLKALKKIIKDCLDVETRVMEIISFSTRDDKLDLVLHLSTSTPEGIETQHSQLTRKLARLKSYQILYLRSAEFCLPETGELNWPLTEIHSAAISDEFCFLEDGFPASRRCVGDFLSGAEWAPVAGNCTKRSVSQVTQTLKEIAKSGQVASDFLSSISAADLSLIDFYYLGLVLRKLSSVETSLEIVNRFMVTDETILTKSQTNLNLTDSVLESLEDSFANLSSSEVWLFSQTNLIVQITNPFQSNISGLLLYENQTIRNFHRTERFEFDGTNLELGVYIPETILEQISNETENLEEVLLVIVIFFNDKLFVDERFRSESAVVSVSIPGYGSFLKSSIQIIFKARKHNPRKCGFWDKGKKENRKRGEWSSLGSSYIPHFNQTDLHLCSYIHLTHFALLVMSDRKSILEENPSLEDFPEATEHNLEILTLVGTCFSSWGILGIFLTAILYPKWRAKIGTKILLNLSVPILLEITCIHLSELDFLKKSPQICKILGVILHYLVLSKFSWMLIYAFLQYYRFVRVLGAIPKNLFFKSIVVGWGCPLVVVFLSALLTHERDYESKSYELCYPRGVFLYVFVLMPIGLIIVANLVIYCLVMYSVNRENDSCPSRKMFKLKMFLALLLFSVLGLPWLFGILAELIAYSGVKIFLFYTFCITATFQGFILFLFYIVMNGETRKFWKRFLTERRC